MLREGGGIQVRNPKPSHWGSVFANTTQGGSWLGSRDLYQVGETQSEEVGVPD
jgi:hypothetical protein